MKTGIRAAPILSFIEKIQVEIISDEHWYLSVLGVDPHLQGKGFGSSLLRYTLKKIDNQGLPLFLETSFEKNVYYYKKFGFKTMKESMIPNTDVNVWFMLRS